MLWEIHPRGGMPHFRQAVAEGKLTVGYFGGSITDGSAIHNWPHFVERWLLDSYPGLRLHTENLAIGATGSDIALMRCQRDMLPQHPQLCVVEYAVNDQTYATEYRTRTREGLLRQLLASGETDVLVVYTYSQLFHPAMAKGEMPDSIAEFEQLCDHYNLPSVWMSARTFHMLERGLIRYDEWLPDGLHPQYAGARFYAQPVCELLAAELAEENPSRQRCGDLPAPFNANHYQHMRLFDFDEVSIQGPVLVERDQRMSAHPQQLVSVALGARMTVAFHGTGMILACNFGSDSCEYRITVDGGEPTLTQRERPAWAGRQGWLRTMSVCEDLPLGDHTVTLEVVYAEGEGCTGMESRIGLIGIV